MIKLVDDSAKLYLQDMEEASDDPMLDFELEAMCVLRHYYGWEKKAAG